MLTETSTLLSPDKKKSYCAWKKWMLLLFTAIALCVISWRLFTSNVESISHKSYISSIEKIESISEIETGTSNKEIVIQNKKKISKSDSSTYLRVGFIEHVVTYANVSTQAEAKAVIHQNLDILEPNIEEAAAVGVKLLQLSEFALTGLMNYVSGEDLCYDRMFLYLEQIPTPNLGTSSTPCENSDFADRPILQRLSCLAKYNSLYLNVNWGDYINCTDTDDTACTGDHLQYNTQIVFSDTGEIVAKYWKIHLFNEQEFDTPSSDDLVYFNMPYGDGSQTVKIGLFTCFDSMYASPSWTLMKDYGINFFLISHWWVNFGTTSTAPQWFESVSREYGINLVAASSGWFKGSVKPRDSSGSGIYSQGLGINTYFNWDSINADYLGYGDINIDIDGPYEKTDVPDYINFTQSTGLTSVYSYLGAATPGTTLYNTAVCSTFTCSFNMVISSSSTSYQPDIWIMFCSDGYYEIADGRGVYYYEQICGAYKAFNSSYLDTMTYTTTKVESFNMTANFTTNAVPFLLMSQEYQFPYFRATTATSSTRVNGQYILTGNTDGDELLDIIVQARDFTQDGRQV